MKMLLLNTIILASSAAIVYGLWLYSHPLALVVGGVATLILACLIGDKIGDKSRSRDLPGGS